MLRKLGQDVVEARVRDVLDIKCEKLSGKREWFAHFADVGCDHTRSALQLHAECREAVGSSDVVAGQAAQVDVYQQRHDREQRDVLLCSPRETPGRLIVAEVDDMKPLQHGCTLNEFLPIHRQ